MNCIRDCMQSVIRFGYAHHIQRLMVLGLFCQLAGVHPRKFHDWHMAMYLDAIDWVSLPNTLGMSQYGDGGIIGTKPYCASGNYIHRMSNYCSGCRYNYREATGDDACPFTTLYWDFLDRHRRQFASNHRMNYQLNNLNRKDADELTAIRRQARILKQKVRNGERI
jgi:deoxyribodipyrimidine photolyase-related protein